MSIARALALAASLLAVAGAAACAQRQDDLWLAGDGSGAGRPEAISLLGVPLYAPAHGEADRTERTTKLEEALAAQRADPDDEEAAIWVGRRLAYLGRYVDAVAAFTEGLARHPQSHRLLRHRGHRFITLRRFDEAIADLDRAALLIEGVADEPEPDGMPNAQNVPRSTTNSNILYHLGLAHFLRGELEPALAAYRGCLDFCANDDMLCATSYWLYLTLARLGRGDAAAAVLAPIRADMEILENFAYHRLLLFFKGELTEEGILATEGGEPAGGGQAPIDHATVAYGVGAWHLIGGRGERARAIFREVVRGDAWAAFGFIAAEAELAR
jgi:tetratricopeptide (TPR) repeat protein